MVNPCCIFFSLLGARTTNIRTDMMTNICPQYNRGSDQSPKAVLTDKFGSSSVGEIFLHLFKEVIDITVENTNRRLRERKHNETDFGEISQVIGVMIANSIQQFPQEQ